MPGPTFAYRGYYDGEDATEIGCIGNKQINSCDFGIGKPSQYRPYGIGRDCGGSRSRDSNIERLFTAKQRSRGVPTSSQVMP